MHILLLMLELDLTYTVVTISTNVADVTQVSKLVREDSDVVYCLWGIWGYMGVGKYEEIVGNETLKGKK